VNRNEIEDFKKEKNKKEVDLKRRKKRRDLF
jgi:hypothetical protein